MPPGGVSSGAGGGLSTDAGGRPRAGLSTSVSCVGECEGEGRGLSCLDREGLGSDGGREGGELVALGEDCDLNISSCSDSSFFIRSSISFPVIGGNACFVFEGNFSSSSELPHDFQSSRSSTSTFGGVVSMACESHCASSPAGYIHVVNGSYVVGCMSESFI